MYGDRGFTQQEFTTAVKRIACVLNSRPVHARMGPTGGVDPDFIEPLTPNMLLLGRSDCHQVPRHYEDTSNATERLAYVCEVEKAWWNQFRCQAFSSLVPTQKWDQEKRSICAGDVVLIHYTGVVKSGEYRRGPVSYTPLTLPPRLLV